MIERIDKIIASQGKYSRSEVKKLIKTGGVKVDGRLVLSSEEKFDADSCNITVMGESLNFKRFVYIMMNKPQGVVSASRDGKQPTVVDILPDSLKREGLFPAGRLDADTTGFVLITDDGELAHRLLAPKSHVDKVYIATLAEPMTRETVTRFHEGVTLYDGTLCMSAEVEAINDSGTQARVTLREGKYHQIKRMFAACGNCVVALKRISFGGIDLDVALEPGQCRELTSEELLKLKKA